MSLIKKVRYTNDPSAAGDDAGPDRPLVIAPRLPDVDAPAGTPDPSPGDEDPLEVGG